MRVGRTAGAAAHLVQTLRQTLGLMHFEVQQHGFCIGRLTIDQLIAGRMLAFRGPILNEAAGGNMRRGLANVGAYADAINRHGSKLSTAKKLKLPEITISILDCLGVRRSGTGRYRHLCKRPSADQRGLSTLNIWAPAAAARLPVFVWIHGGALQSG